MDKIRATLDELNWIQVTVDGLQEVQDLRAIDIVINMCEIRRKKLLNQLCQLDKDTGGESQDT